jgi:hypothetical protein
MTESCTASHSRYFNIKKTFQKHLQGVLVCLGKDTVVSVPFGKVTPYFMPKDKSAEICKKYFKKGKSVKVQIASRFKKTLQVS